MEPHQIPPFPQDGATPDLAQPKTPAEADAARAALLEAIETARKALEALPASPAEATQAVAAVEETPIAAPENIPAPAPEPPAGAKQAAAAEPQLEEKPPVTTTIEAPEERAAREDDALHPEPVEIRYWRKAQIDAMNEDLAAAFEKSRDVSGKPIPFEVAPLTFSKAPFPSSEAEDDCSTTQEFPMGGTDGSQVVLPS